MLLSTQHLLLVSVHIPIVLSLWPIPRSLDTGSTALKLSPDFAITTSFSSAVPQDIQDAISRTSDFLKNDKLKRLVPGRGKSDDSALSSAAVLPGLVLSWAAEEPSEIPTIASEAVKEIGTREEAYSLVIPTDGKPAELRSNSSLGLFRGLTTFEQIWFDRQGERYTLEAPFDIEDSPAFPYRGLMLDTARNYFPVDDIKRTLDAMSWVKMSTFHWHIVDSQSFPLVLEEMPEISEAGAYSEDEVYRPEDVQSIVQYAAARGIDVLMEIDTPGHTSIIFESHPEHIACHEASPWRSFANEPPAGQLRLANEATTKFTADLITAASKNLPSKYFSTGGDELNTNCYDKDEQTQNDLKASGKTFEQALGAFVQATHKALEDVGKTPVVWEEMILEHELGLSNETIALVWLSSEHAASVADKGFRLVHAPSDFFYLDCGAGEWLGNNPQGNSWCDPFKTWQKAYTFDPLASIPDAQQSLVLGGQQLLWTEQASPSNMDSIIWPRAAVSAEVFWTGNSLPDGSSRKDSGKVALPRLNELGERMVNRGVRAIALQPQWCILRPGACDIDA
jgi:hexosaminidase